MKQLELELDEAVFFLISWNWNIIERRSCEAMEVEERIRTFNSYQVATHQKLR